VLEFRSGLCLSLALDLLGILELPAHAEFAVNERDAGKLVDCDAYVEQCVSRKKMVELGPQASWLRGGDVAVVVGHERKRENMSACSAKLQDSSAAINRI
jgi:hypothetical protein